MLFLIFSNTDIQFTEKKLIYRFYFNAKALSTIKQIKFIDKKEFIKAELNKELKTFVVYVVALKTLLSKIIIYFSQKAQITALKQNEVPTKISINYLDFSDIFFDKKNLSTARANQAQ